MSFAIEILKTGDNKTILKHFRFMEWGDKASLFNHPRPNFENVILSVLNRCPICHVGCADGSPTDAQPVHTRDHYRKADQWERYVSAYIVVSVHQLLLSNSALRYDRTVNDIWHFAAMQAFVAKFLTERFNESGYSLDPQDALFIGLLSNLAQLQPLLFPDLADDRPNGLALDLSVLLGVPDSIKRILAIVPNEASQDLDFDEISLYELTRLAHLVVSNSFPYCPQRILTSDGISDELLTKFNITHKDFENMKDEILANVQLPPESCQLCAANHGNWINPMKKILVVDDTPWVRDLITEVLEGIGLVVITSQNGMEGIAAFDLHHPDLVITDVIMTKVDGLSFIRMLRKRAPDLPILVISGGSPVFDPTHLLRIAKIERADAVLQKPFEISALIESVMNLLGDRSTRRPEA